MTYKQRGFTRVYKAMIYSGKGLREAFLREAAFRQELFLACIFIPLAHLVDVNKIERILLVSTVVLVLLIELINTAIEAVVDRMGYDYHELSGVAKDVGSAAVLISLLLWGYVWGSILFLP